MPVPRCRESGKLDVSPEAGVAQLVEQLIRNQQVIGSSPIAGSSLRPQHLFRATAGRPVFLANWRMSLPALSLLCVEIFQPNPVDEVRGHKCGRKDA